MSAPFQGAAVPASLREANLRTIFDLLRLEGTLSRAEIVRRTGISGPTVSSAIRFLVQKRIIREIGEGQGHLGRKPILMQFEPEAALTIGIDLGGNSIDVGVVDLLGRVVAHVSRPCAGDVISHEELAFIPGLVGNVLNSARGRILGVGVGVPGVIDPLSGAVQLAPQLDRGGQEWSTLQQRLQEQLALPLCLENDVNAAALGEQHARAKDAPSNFVFVSVGGGIGAGLVFEGRLYRGARNAAGEIGYMIVDGNRPRERGDFGGLERIASCPALLARARSLGWSAPSVTKVRLDDAIRQLGRAARRDVSRRNRPWMKARTTWRWP